VIALMAFLILVSFLMMGYGAAAMARQREQAAEALRERLGAAGVEPKESARSSILKDQRLSHITFLNNLLNRTSLTAPLARLIRQAGLSTRVGEVVMYIPLLACTAALLAILATGNPLMAFAFAVLGGLIPTVVLQAKRNKRMRLFSEQLPDALDLIRAALQAGHSFTTALYVVADEFPDPISEELRIVAEEVRLGLPLRDALYNLRDRVNDMNIPILIVGVLVAQEVGGNLAEVLDNTSYTIRERFKLLRDIQVMTAQGRLSGAVLTCLPIFVGAFMYFLNPEYFAPMLEDQRGWYMLGYAVISIMMGHYMIRRIVNIRV
jgi:tight adherence protein B